MIVRVVAIGAVAVTVAWRAADLRCMDVKPFKVAHFDGIGGQILPRSAALLIHCSLSQLISSLIPLEAEGDGWHGVRYNLHKIAVRETCNEQPAMRKSTIEAQRNGRAAGCTYVFLVCS